MRRIARHKIFLLLPVLAAALSPCVPAQSFETEKLAEGVFAVVRRGPPGLMFDANNVFIVGERDVIVVDSNFSHASTREVLAALRKITDKPVRYVVNTHWHDDHITGNQIYREAFPGVEFIGHESAARDMAAQGAKNRKGLQENAPNLIKLFRSQVEKKKNLAGADLSEEERESYLKDALLLENYAASVPALEIIAPTIAVKDKLVLRQGARAVEVLHAGRGHTPADLIVRLPGEGILITGDLVVHPVPLVGSTSLPADYAATLERLLAMKPKIIVPGHGAVMRDAAHVRQMINLLNSINAQTRAAVRRGENLEQVRKSVDLEEFRRLFAGDSQNKSFIFRTYVAQPGVEAAYRQAAAAPGEGAEKSGNNPPMVLVPGATFEMGTNEEEIPKLLEIFKVKRAELFAGEVPRHRVRIDAFYLDKYEVKNADFKKFLDKDPAWQKDKIPAEFHNGKYLRGWEGGDFPPGRATHPVVYVSWHAAVAFCRSQGKRLPTEAEWEYAARGGLDGKQFPWGDEPPSKTLANFFESGIGSATAVGSYPANGYGLFDMSGNVWEFLADEWQPYPSTVEILVNPVAGGDFFDTDSYRRVKTRRVIRGGSFGGAPVNLRVGYRDSHQPDNAGDHVGFRCAQNVSAKKTG